MPESNLYFEPRLKPEDVNPSEDLIAVAHPRGGINDRQAMSLADLGASVGGTVVSNYDALKTNQYPHDYSAKNALVRKLTTNIAGDGDLDGAQNDGFRGITVWPLLCSIGGGFYLSVGDSTGMSFPRLQVVMGDCEWETDEAFAPSGIFEFPELRVVAGYLNFYYIDGVKLDFPKLEQVGGNFEMSNLTNILNDVMVFHELVDVGGDFSLGGPIPFSEIAFPKLERIGGDWFGFEGYPPDDVIAASKILVPALREVSGSFFLDGGPDYAPNLTRMDFPSLVAVGTEDLDNSGYFQIFNHPKVTAVTTPKLETLWGELDLTGNPVLNVLGFPLLRRLQGLSVVDCPVLERLDFPALEYLGGNGINIDQTGTTGNGMLKNLTFGPGLKQCDGQFYIVTAPFTQATVDGILRSLARLDGTNGTVPYYDSIINLVGLCAPPSAAGLADKAILEARSVTVNHN